MTARFAVLVLFFLSGACGLVYEVVWTRQLSLVFGVTVFAASAVLAAYMAGLALGSLLVGRYVDRVRNPVRVYALLEVGIGLSALAVPAAMDALSVLYRTLSGQLEHSFLLFNFVRALLALLLLLVPTTLMGGTVPAMARFLVHERERVGWNVALLYGLNTFGAVLGVLLAGFVFVPELGLRVSTLIAVVGNASIGTVLLLARVEEPGVPRLSPPPADLHTTPPTSTVRHALLAGVVFGLSGFVALAYEVIWTRVLVVHVHSSTYAFTMMLAVFLAGLALGDALLIRVYDRVRRPLAWLGCVQLLVGLSVVVAATPTCPCAASACDCSGSRAWRAGRSRWRSPSCGPRW